MTRKISTNNQKGAAIVDTVMLIVFCAAILIPVFRQLDQRLKLLDQRVANDTARSAPSPIVSGHRTVGTQLAPTQ